MTELQKLIEGYKSFYQKFFVEDNEVYKKLSRDGQAPRVAVIACSDSRADPSIITSAEPGDMFVIRNVANLVPPYQPDTTTYHGTSAALEFAISNLKVAHLVVLGHSKCAGIRSLMESGPKSDGDSFVSSWMTIAADVREKIKHDHADLSADQQIHICEKKAVEKSIVNLHSFPWIKDKIQSCDLKVHGWYFDIDKGKLFNFEGGIWKEIS